MCPPRELPRHGAFLAAPHLARNASFRFAVRKSEKNRACDDLKQSVTNLLRSVGIPNNFTL